MPTSFAVDGKRVALLVHVSVDNGDTKQSNKFYNMYEQTDGTMKCVYGRVDSTEKVESYPIERWDSIYKQKTSPKKNYKDVTHLYAQETGDSSFAEISDTVVNKLINTLQQYATNSVKQNYTVSAKSVTKAMVDEAQSVIDGLAKTVSLTSSVKSVNDELLKLYHIIPRKMNNVATHLVQTTADTILTNDILESVKKLIDDEQATLDVMAGQVRLETPTTDKTTNTPKTILDILGVGIEKATDQEIDHVKTLMGPNAHQVCAVYKVVHYATQKRFDEHLSKISDKTVNHFFHGSRNQNWLNIISTGLLIRPSGAVHNGSMFGDGIYFADKAQKSIGYTSLSGSYWARGNDNRGYLAVFSVHTGKQKHIHRHDSSCYRLCKQQLDREQFDSVFAHGGADLRNNEYIVYDSSQCTISYLVEIK